jgi:hypothetical protein
MPHQCLFGNGTLGCWQNTARSCKGRGLKRIADLVSFSALLDGYFFVQGG